jgi:hypothetical protein
MKLRSPASTVLAASSVVLALTGAALSSAIAGSEPALVGGAMVVTTAVLSVTLLFGRVAGTLTSLGVLAAWAALGVATADAIDPLAAATLGATIYLCADTAIESLASRAPASAGDAFRRPWLPRLGVAGAGASVAYLLLWGLDDAPDASTAWAFGAVILTLLTLTVFAAAATAERRSPATSGTTRSGS